MQSYFSRRFSDPDPPFFFGPAHVFWRKSLAREKIAACQDTDNGIEHIGIVMGGSCFNLERDILFQSVKNIPSDPEMVFSLIA